MSDIRPENNDPNSASDELARLAATDAEAATPDPDLSEVRARVMARAADSPQRRKGMLIAAGVAAACALLAGTAVAGVAVGRNTAPAVVVSAEAAPSAVPMIGLGNAGANPAAGRANEVGMPQRDAMGAPAGMGGVGTATSGVAADKAMASYYPYFFGGNQIFTAAADVSSVSPGTATAYTIDATGVDRVALAKSLAKTFGVKGDPVKDEWGTVVVGPQDGSGPTIYVGNDAMASWSYYDPSTDPWSTCVYDDVMPMEKGVGGGASVDPQPAPDATDSTEANSGSSPAPAPAPTGPSCNDNTGPDAKTSQDQAKALLAKIGVSQDVQWETTVQGPATVATAWTLVEGMRTQLSSSVTFSSEGVSSAYGNAAGVTPIEGYPVVSAKEAVDRSSDPRWRAFGPTMSGGGVYPMAMDATARGNDSPSTPPAAPERDGRPVVQVPLSEVVLSGGDRSLVQYWQLDGTLMLLPGYRFTDAAGAEWDIISVAEAAVDFSTP